MNHLIQRFIPLATCSLLAFSSASSAKVDDYNKMQKQLAIMSNILKSSMNENSRKKSRISTIDSTYLKGQGVVFTIKTGSFGHSWGSYSFDVPDFVVPVPPVAPSAPHEREIIIRSDYDEDIEDIVSEALEDVNHAFEVVREEMDEDRENYRQLRELERELAYESRELERDKRELEFKLRRSNKDDIAEAKSELKELEQRRIKVEKERTSIKQRSAEYKKQQQAKAKKREQERRSFYQTLETNVAQVLCDYGNGLRELPDREHVSVILKSAGMNEKGRYNDKIFVFKKSDIKSCANEKISSDKLLSNASGYQF